MLNLKGIIKRINFFKKESFQDFLDTLSVAYVGSLLIPYIFIFALYLLIKIGILPKHSISPKLLYPGLLALSLFLGPMGSTLAFLIFTYGSKPSSFFKSSSLKFKIAFIFFEPIFVILFTIWTNMIWYAFIETFFEDYYYSSNHYETLFLTPIVIGILYLSFKGAKLYITTFITKKRAASFLLSLFWLFFVIIFLPLESASLLLTIEKMESLGSCFGEIAVLSLLYFLTLQTAFSFALGKVVFEYLTKRISNKSETFLKV